MGKKIAWHPPPGQTVSVGTDIFHHRAYFAFPFRIRETHCFRRESLPPSICKFKRRSTYDSVPASSPPKPSNLFHPSCTLRRPQNRGKPRRRRKAEGGQKIERNGRRGRGRIIIGICPSPRRPPPPTSAPFSSPAVEIGQNCSPPPIPPQDFAETNGAAPAEGGGGGGSFNASLPPPLLFSSDLAIFFPTASLCVFDSALRFSPRRRRRRRRRRRPNFCSFAFSSSSTTELPACPSFACLAKRKGGNRKGLFPPCPHLFPYFLKNSLALPCNVTLAPWDPTTSRTKTQLRSCFF